MSKNIKPSEYNIATSESESKIEDFNSWDSYLFGEQQSRTFDSSLRSLFPDSIDQINPLSSSQRSILSKSYPNPDFLPSPCSTLPPSVHIHSSLLKNICLKEVPKIQKGINSAISPLLHAIQDMKEHKASAESLLKNMLASINHLKNLHKLSHSVQVEVIKKTNGLTEKKKKSTDIIPQETFESSYSSNKNNRFFGKGRWSGYRPQSSNTQTAFKLFNSQNKNKYRAKNYPRYRSYNRHQNNYYYQNNKQNQYPKQYINQNYNSNNNPKQQQH